MSVLVNPELGRMAVREGLESAFTAWSVLRAYGVAENHSSHFTTKEAGEILAASGMDFSERHYRNIWKKGLHIFWSFYQGKLCLRSYRRVARHFEALLKPCDERYQVKHFFVEIELSGGILDLRAELYRAWFLQWEEKTIARDTLADLFGLSHDQQRACEKALGAALLVKTNYAHIDLEEYKAAPREMPEHHFTITYEREVRFDEDVDTVAAIQYQLPNTFIARARSGNPFPVTDAPNRARKAMRTLSRHTQSLLPQERTYWLKWSQFEKLGSMDGFIRAYYQGKKRLWLSGNYL
jgi:hypothetical protein